MDSNRHLAASIALAAGLWAGTPAEAEVVLDASFNTSGTPWATIERSSNQFSLAGPLVQESVYTGPFSVTATGWTTAGPFDAFCVDVWHDMGTSNPGIAAVPVGPLSGITGAPYFDVASAPRIGNEMAFLMNDYGDGTNWTADQKGGVQLVLWDLVDPRFKVVSTSTAGLMSAFTGLLGLLNGQSWDGLTAYDPSKTYGGGTFFQVTHVGDLYQDLVTEQSAPGPGTLTPDVIVPEPASLLTAGLAGLMGLGFARCRRRSAAG